MTMHRILGMLLLLPLLAACGASPTGAPAASASGQLTIAGSSALFPLIEEAAKQFQAQNPNAQISVAAGGSGEGRKQACSGQVIIGMSDVALSDEERGTLNCADAVQTPIVLQAFAPVANTSGLGTVTSLTKDQLVAVFSGQVTNWNELGGTDQPIVVINRAQGSGTRAVMAKYLFGGDDSRFATGEEEDSSDRVLERLKTTPGAVSYLGFAFINDEQIVALAIDRVEPNSDSVLIGDWTIAEPGYAITKGLPNGLANAFLTFLTSPEFQKSDAMGRLGFVPITR